MSAVRQGGVGASNELATLRVHDAFVDFVERSVWRTRNYAASNPRSALDFLKQLLTKIAAINRFFPQFWNVSKQNLQNCAHRRPFRQSLAEIFANFKLLAFHCHPSHSWRRYNNFILCGLAQTIDVDWRYWKGRCSWSPYVAFSLYIIFVSVSTVWHAFVMGGRSQLQIPLQVRAFLFSCNFSFYVMMHVKWCVAQTIDVPIWVSVGWKVAVSISPVIVFFFL